MLSENNILSLHINRTNKFDQLDLAKFLSA